MKLLTRGYLLGALCVAIFSLTLLCWKTVGRVGRAALKHMPVPLRLPKPAPAVGDDAATHLTAKSQKVVAASAAALPVMWPVAVMGLSLADLGGRRLRK
jgi:hypothetical protein